VLGDRNQLVWLLERQRLEQHAVHDTEHGAVGADPERQRQNRHRRERRGFDEGAQREPEILEHIGTAACHETDTGRNREITRL
jgi:hypothetical protein